MIEVTLECQECSTTVNFASGFEPGPVTPMADTQAHMDTQFVARCGRCFACDWEVVNVKKIEFPNGAPHRLHAV